MLLQGVGGVQWRPRAHIVVESNYVQATRAITVQHARKEVREREVGGVQWRPRAQILFKAITFSSDLFIAVCHSLWGGFFSK